MKNNNIIIVLFLLLSCGNNHNKLFNEEILKKLSDGNCKFPSKYGSVSLFVLSENEEIIETNSDYLKYVYENHYVKEYSSFYLFLDKVLNEKIKIPKINFNKTFFLTFKVDKRIYNKFLKNGFNSFYKEYVVQSKQKVDNYELNIKNKSFIELKTIIYLLYLNGYSVNVDDYIGKYYVCKTIVMFYK
jgi:hypothetical protein